MFKCTEALGCRRCLLQLHCLSIYRLPSFSFSIFTGAFITVAIFRTITRTFHRHFSVLDGETSVGVFIFFALLHACFLRNFCGWARLPELEPAVCGLECWFPSICPRYSQKPCCYDLKMILLNKCTWRPFMLSGALPFFLLAVSMLAVVFNHSTVWLQPFLCPACCHHLRSILRLIWNLIGRQLSQWAPTSRVFA